MRRTTTMLLSVLLLLAGCGGGFEPAEFDSPGQNLRVGDLLIRYARLGPIPNSPAAAGSDISVFMTIVNESSRADRLVHVSSKIASSASLHRAPDAPPAPSITIPGRGTLLLDPDHAHAMLVSLDRELPRGAFVDVTLRFAHAGDVTLQLHSSARTYDNYSATQ